jgi:acylphosphatase
MENSKETGRERPASRHFHIQGLVQGVGYRAGFAAQARALGLNGRVRNRSDGSVEALVCGSAEPLRQLTEWAGHGPRAAQVRTLQVRESSANDDDCTPGFEIRPTR